MRQILSKLVIVLALGMAPIAAGLEAPTGKNFRNTYLEITKKQQQQKSFVVLTPQGASVELVGVYNLSLDDCWRPDGSKLDEKIYVKDKRVLQQKDEYSFILKVKGTDDISFKFYDIKGAARWDYPADVTDSKGQKLDTLRAVNAHIEDGRSYTSLRAAIAAGPWRTVAQFNAQENTPQTSSDITLSNIRQFPDHLSIFISDKSQGNSDRSIMAIDNDGNTHKGRIDDSVPNRRSNSITVKFPDLKLAQIDKFRLQKRPFRTVEFKDISLRPEVTRKVEIEVERFSDDKALPPEEKNETAQSLLEHVESTIKLIDGRTVKEQILNVPFPEGARLVLENTNGSIEVNGWEKNVCRVTANIEVGLRDNQKAEELLEKISIMPKLSYKKIAVGITPPEKVQNENAPKVDFQIMVPKTADLELNTNTGAITLVDVTGEIECKTNEGVMLAQKINGNVRLRNNYGKILINSSNFDNAVIRGNTADVSCEDISGNINVRVSVGQVKVQYAKTAPDICNVTIATTDGDIDFTGPANFSADVHAGTLKGEIQSDFPLKIQGKRRKTASGTLGSGNGKLSIRSTVGSIRIHENIP
jgi:hypothetical protein